MSEPETKTVPISVPAALDPQLVKVVKTFAEEVARAFSAEPALANLDDVKIEVRL